MKTEQPELFTAENEPTADWTHLEEVNPCRPIDPTGAGEYSIRSARINSRAGQLLALRKTPKFDLNAYDGLED